MMEIDTTNLDLKKKIVLDKWGEILKQEMIIRAPKEYGTMAASIEAERTGDEVSVGTHTGKKYPVYVEYGTGTIDVGSPEKPRTTWAALRKRNEVGQGQTMPFARSSSFLTEDARIDVLKEAFK